VAARSIQQPRASTAGRSHGKGGGSGLVPGTLSVRWIHGSKDCGANTDPEVQVHAYNAATYILRQNKCRTFEAPFVYVLTGSRMALVLDSGDLNNATLRETIRPLVGSHPILVAHSHAHSDHIGADSSFNGQPATIVVGTSRGAVQAAFGITTWPTSQGQLDLGSRVLDVLPIPGHEATHIALYDRQTGLLLTGDTLYPGLLFVADWPSYRASVSRLAQFVRSHPIAHVLGAHIEMTSRPKVNYAYGTRYQPHEHVLQLSASHVTELDAALTALGSTKPAQPVAHADFVIYPR
jgi:hydroxyacylglutathione hydrolase